MNESGVMLSNMNQLNEKDLKVWIQR
jgi:hypothetical protein